MLGLVRVRYCKVSTMEWYSIESTRGPPENFNNFPPKLQGVDTCLAPTNLIRWSKSVTYLSWWRWRLGTILVTWMLKKNDNGPRFFLLQIHCSMQK